ncbi:MAG: 30S ribosome-binding factor RbfA [Acidimicrobiaceae bacterium]|jgi:ribosome-binding factor A|nr:30S ribosome-binding factor RbfA [Acidimicrobiaceae bacterium]
MTKPRRPQAPSTHRYPRTARLSTSLQEVIADELTRIDDERLALVTITAIDVDPEMNRAIVFFDSLMGDEADAHILVALADHRVRIQGSVARQLRSKKTPILSFKPDESIRAAERIERILHDKATLPERPPSPIGDTDNDTDNDSDSDADTHTGDTLTGDNARDGE